MKKNLALLTGIVFVITILLATGCDSGKTNKDTESSGNDNETTTNVSPDVKQDSTKVKIYLKAVVIDGSWHLEMYEEKKSDCPVIDGLITVVYGGYTVTWKKLDNSIKNITKIDAIDDFAGIFGKGVERTGTESLWTLIIPEEPEPDTIKYEIHFTVPGVTDTIIIDPYLKVPPSHGGG